MINHCPYPLTQGQSPMREKLREILEELHLQGMAECLDRELDRAEKEAIPAADLLYRLALEERRVRQEKSLANRLKQARMPWDWTLESFPFTQQPGVNKTQDQDPRRSGLRSPCREPGLYRSTRHRQIRSGLQPAATSLFQRLSLSLLRCPGLVG